MIVLILLFSLLVASPATATVWWVSNTLPSTGSCSAAANDGSTPPSVYLPTIAAGLSCAGGFTANSGGNTVRVRGGIYNETIDNQTPFGSSWSAPFILESYANERVEQRSSTYCLNLQRVTGPGGQPLAVAKFFIWRGSPNAKWFCNNLSIEFTYISDIKIFDIEMTRPGLGQNGMFTVTDRLEATRVYFHNVRSGYGWYLSACEPTQQCPTGVGVTGADNVLQDSVFEHMDAYCLHLNNHDFGPQRTIVRRNVFINCADDPGDVPNQPPQGGSAIFNGSSQALIYNNVMISTGYGPTGNPTPNQFTPGYWQGGNGVDSLVFNNVAYGNKWYGFYDDGWPPYELRNNIAWNNATGSILSTDPTIRAASNNLCNSGCSNNTRPGKPAGGPSINGQDPQFVNPASRNFAIPITSPANNAGFNMQTPQSPVPYPITDNLDAAGVTRPQGGSWDIGACEFISGGGVCPTTVIGPVKSPPTIVINIPTTNPTLNVNTTPIKVIGGSSTPGG